MSAAYQGVSGKVRVIIPAEWPPEIAAVLNRGLLVPSGLYLYYTLETPPSGGGCPGGKTVGVYDADRRRVAIYTEWRGCYGGASYEDMLFWTGHELGHAHQQRMLLDAGLPDSDFSNWARTTEGQAFIAAGGRLTVPGYSSVSPLEDFANMCGLWYIRRALLRQYDPGMYAFAQAWLPQ
jgi:hypothetical protein